MPLPAADDAAAGSEAVRLFADRARLADAGFALDDRTRPLVAQIVARLDEANKSGNPILLRTSTSSGHGIGTALSERIKQLADEYSFLFAQLGMSRH